MATIIARPMIITTVKSAKPAVALMFANCAGIVLTTLVKMRIDIPLPTPRWVTSSPIHITTAVPAVMVRTISATWGTSKFGIRLSPLGS